MSCIEGQNRQIIIYTNNDTVSLLLIPRVHLTDYTFIPLEKGPTFRKSLNPNSSNTD